MPILTGCQIHAYVHFCSVTVWLIKGLGRGTYGLGLGLEGPGLGLGLGLGLEILALTTSLVSNYIAL